MRRVTEIMHNFWCVPVARTSSGGGVIGGGMRQGAPLTCGCPQFMAGRVALHRRNTFVVHARQKEGEKMMKIKVMTNLKNNGKKMYFILKNKLSMYSVQ